MTTMTMTTTTMTQPITSPLAHVHGVIISHMYSPSLFPLPPLIVRLCPHQLTLYSCCIHIIQWPLVHIHP